MRPSFLRYVSLAPLLWSAAASAEPVRVLDTDFPDPCLISTNGKYYAFATTGNGVNVQIAQSDDFVTWERLAGTDALPGPFPSWVASSPTVWAPDVIQRLDGTYVMYYSALSSTDPSKHCFGAATSTSITGPYKPEDNYIACPLDQGGAIDPDGFIDDDGTMYVVYKVDGSNLDGDGTIHPTPIMLQALEPDGITPTGDPIKLLDRDASDGILIEAPSLVRSVVSGTYFLSYSSHYYASLHYDVGYATGPAVKGPFTKAQAPLLVTGDNTTNAGPLGGPGGADFSVDGTRIVFHAFENGRNLTNGRALYTSGIVLEGDVIRLV